MNQLNPDLEANLIDEASYYDENYSPSHISHPEQVEVVGEPDPLQVGTNDFDASPRFNIVSIMISTCKVIASSVVLLIMPHPCTSLSEIWVFCMLAHDIMNIFTLSLKLKNIFAIRNLSQNQTSQPEPVRPENEGQNDRPQELHGLGNESAVQEEQEPENRANQENEVNEDEFIATAIILKRIQRIKILSHLCLWFWSALFVTGICLNAFMDLTPCQTPETDRLLIAYLVFAGIWLFSPVLLLVVGCVCLPVLLVLVWFIGRPKPANNAAIKKLPVIKYSEDLPGEKECIICMVEYQESDKIVQLKCNPMHHFHEKCGKKWLKINGQCPMCRERIDQTAPSSNNQREESGPNN